MNESFLTRIDSELTEIKELVHQCVSNEEKTVVGYQLEEILRVVQCRKVWLKAGLEGIREKEQGL